VGARSKARKRAVDVLYAAALRDADPVTLHAERTSVAEHPSPDDYATTLIEGVVAHRERIDELLTEHAEGWTLDRMPAVDRNLSRIAVYEIVFRDDIDDAVAVSEAVELAEELSTDNSPRFLNGLLARIAEYAAP